MSDDDLADLCDVLRRIHIRSDHAGRDLIVEILDDYSIEIAGINAPESPENT